MGSAPFVRRHCDCLASSAPFTNIRLTYLLTLACFIVLWFIRAPFYVLLVFVAVCSVFWLFWLSCHYMSSDWLERPLWGSLIVARGSSPESPGRGVRHDFLGLLYCFIVLLCICVVSCSYLMYYPTVMARCSLFVLKVPLNPKQTNKPKSIEALPSVLWLDDRRNRFYLFCGSIPVCYEVFYLTKI